MTKSKVIIRDGRYTDIPHMERLIYDGIKTSKFPYPDPQYPHLYYSLTESVSNGMVHVAIRDRQLIGMAVLGIGHFPWAPDRKFLVDSYWLVDSQHRASGAGSLLLDAMKRHAENVGVMLIVGNTNGVDVERKDNLIMRRGFDRIGGTYAFMPALPAHTEH